MLTSEQLKVISNKVFLVTLFNSQPSIKIILYCEAYFANKWKEATIK